MNFHNINENLNIQNIDEKEIWEDFLLQCKEKTFLQSWNWGEFQKKMGNKIWRLGVFLNNELVATSFIYKVVAKRGTFLFLPHGPNIKSKVKNQKSKILEIIVDQLKKIAKEEKASFIRIAPIWARTREHKEIFKKLGFKEAPIHIHPELTWQLDITLSEKELLMGMRKTTRYLIRQGLKQKDLQIIKSKDAKEIEIFNKLYQETVRRQHFVPFSLNYLKNEFLTFLRDDQILVFLAKYKKETIAAGIFLFWQGIAFYHHGASSQKYPKIPASYLLQWEAIKEAKKRGCKVYNFWGIAESGLKNKKHPWWGLTLFKMGFGGERKEYVKTQDLPLSKLYWFNFFVEKIRKIKRGL